MPITSGEFTVPSMSRGRGMEHRYHSLLSSVACRVRSADRTAPQAGCETGEYHDVREARKMPSSRDSPGCELPTTGLTSTHIGGNACPAREATAALPTVSLVAPDR